MRQTKLEFTQEAHCCLDVFRQGEPKVTLELMDGGGGEFLVLTANQWAVETPEEVDALAAEMKALLAKAKGIPDVAAE